MLADWVRSLSSGTPRNTDTIDGIEYRWRGAISDSVLLVLGFKDCRITHGPEPWGLAP